MHYEGTVARRAQRSTLCIIIAYSKMCERKEISSVETARAEERRNRVAERMSCVYNIH